VNARRLSALLCIVLAVACVAGWWFSRTAFLAAYLAAWWFCIGVAMGGLANVWIHNLTGGAWGEAIRQPLLDIGRRIWLLALLFLPVLLGYARLYPWAPDAAMNAQRWAGELPAASAAFKSAWLSPAFFVARGVACLVAWSLLGWFSARPPWVRSKRFAAIALMVYGITVSIAAVDWIMSLMPLWYSSVFGLLAGTGQMLAGMAFAVVLLVRKPGPPPPPLVFRDLGNFLLMYVMTWAYLAFTQFLIIWAANLPHEIGWYAVRARTGWLVVAWGLMAFHFCVPLAILLVRRAKEAPAMLASLAVGLLAAHLVDAWWLVLPSVTVDWPPWLWAAPLTAAALITFALAATSPWMRVAVPTPRGQGESRG
jgi:hypothetical protein